MSLRDQSVSPRLTPQQERVLAAARRINGVCQVDLLLPDVCDGGPPITRLAARLHELDELGYSFECLGWRSRTKVWRLVEPAGVGAGVVPSVSLPPCGASHAGDDAGPSTRLFEVGEPEMGAYEWDLRGEAA